MNLTNEQREAVEIIVSGHNLFITGQAGTGKSFLIKRITEILTKQGKTVAVTATTGIAATQFQHGRTIHSWSGVEDGRYSMEEAVQRISADKTISQRIQSTDVLIIDEISMLSAKLFDQVEYVCRTVRKNDLCFGGIQMICVGDFFQLRPVANDLYEDEGKHAFLSPVWTYSFPHKLHLQQVVRQTDTHLITAIDELEKGHPSHSTNRLMKSQMRPLALVTGEAPIVLYGTNFEVDCHNASCLEKMPNEMHIFSSEDTGNSTHLKKMLAKKHLSLKLGCPVILLKNMSSTLVNGGRGTVLSIDNDGPTVKFKSGVVVKLQKHSFTTYDPQLQKIVAERVQFPINLAFALTIHKSQGQTFPRVVVNCRNILQPGQLGVAIGRAVSLDGLQVLHYRPTCSIPHPDHVMEFHGFPGVPLAENLSCCKEVKITKEHGGSCAGYTTPEDLSDDTLSDYNEEELKLIDILVETEEQDKAEPALQDMQGTHGQGETSQEILLGEDVGHGTLPTSSKHFTQNNTQQFVESLLNPFSITEEQKNVNSLLNLLIFKHVNEAIKYLNKQHSIVFSLLPKKTDKPTTTKEWSTFYHSYHQYLDSATYLEDSENFMKSVCNPGMEKNCRQVCGRLMAALRKMAVESMTDHETSDLSETHTGAPVRIKTSGHGKIRYVGGRCIAKLKHRYMNLVRTKIENGKPFPHQYTLKVRLFESLTVSQDIIKENTKYRESLQETLMRQNLSCGLTNITDSVFEFFLLLEYARMPLYVKEQLSKHGSNVLKYVRESLTDDSNLFRAWTSLVCQDFATSAYSTTSGIEDEDVKDVLQTTADVTVAVLETFQEVVNSYCCITDNEYRKKLRSEMGRKKEMEHRKKVLQRSKPIPTTLTMADIDKDTSSKKNISHIKLKGAVLDNTKNLEKFSKSELVKIGKLYGKTLSLSKKKDELVKTLASVIESSQEMVTVCESNQPPPTGSSSGISSYPTQGTSSDTSCLPLQGSSSRTIITPLHSTGSSKSTRKEVSGKKKRQRIEISDSEEEKEEKKKSSKETKKGKGKRKGKAKGRQKLKIHEEIDEDFCFGCLEIYHDGDEEPWIGCSKCERWWHRSCGGIQDEESWETFSREGAEWTCPVCMK